MQSIKLNTRTIASDGKVKVTKTDIHLDKCIDAELINQLAPERSDDDMDIDDNSLACRWFDLLTKTFGTFAEPARCDRIFAHSCSSRPG